MITVDSIVSDIRVDDIVVGARRRAVTPAGIARMVTWLADGGQRTPISVRIDGDPLHPILIAGAHRLAAAKQLGWSTIRCTIETMDSIEAQLWEIAENLHRNELTALERDEQVAAWIGLAKERRGVSSQVATKIPPSQRGRPESGVNAAARELGISKDAAHRATKVAALAPEAKEAARELGLADNRTALLEAARHDTAQEQVAAIKERTPVNGARSIMASRAEADDSLDYFPTPPWATRALVEHVLRPSGHSAVLHAETAWEPACGEGHIAEVLGEYFGAVTATDIHDYGYGDGPRDFLASDRPDDRADWIITNPPFNGKAEAFVLRAMERADVGVAMFLRLQWMETVGRYDRIFKPHPPFVIAQFAERVPLHRGRWEPDGDTATAYLWIVWLKKAAACPTEFMWIPPGQREALSRPDDRERFTARPVVRAIRDASIPADTGVGPVDEPYDPRTGELSPDPEPPAEYPGRVTRFDPNGGAPVPYVRFETEGGPVDPKLIAAYVTEKLKPWHPLVEVWRVQIDDGEPYHLSRDGEPVEAASTGGDHEDLTPTGNAMNPENAGAVAPAPAPRPDDEDIPAFLRKGTPENEALHAAAAAKAQREGEPS